jgi:hypothetical protein
MKKAVALLSVLLAILTGLNAVTPVMSDSIRAFFSIEPQTASVEESAKDYTVNDAENTAQKASGKKQVAYEGKKILIYDFDQLSKIGSGKSHKYDDGVSATYSADADYKLARDIAVPRHTTWKLPDGFKGTITGTKQKNVKLYDSSNDRIYVYNPYQLPYNEATADWRNRKMKNGLTITIRKAMCWLKALLRRRITPGLTKL